MRKWRFFLGLLLLTVSGAVWAQDSTNSCGALNEADCALLTQARVALADADSASFQFTMELAMIDHLEDLTLGVDGTGAYSGYQPEVNAQTPDEVTRAIHAFNSELSLTLSSQSYSFRGSNIPEEITLELRLVDGLGYINFDRLQPLINDPSVTGWGGVDLARLIGALMEDYPDEIARLGRNSGLSSAVAVQIDGTVAVEQYVTTTRTDDGSGETAFFEITVDFNGLMNESAVADPVRAILEQELRQNDVTLSAAEARNMTELIMRVLERETYVQVIEEIDVVTGLLRSINFYFSIDFGNNVTFKGLLVVLQGMLTFDFEDLPVISAPDDVGILPYRQLLSLIGAMLEQAGANADN